MALPALLLFVLATAAMEVPEFESWVRREAAASGHYHSSPGEAEEAGVLSKSETGFLTAIEAADSNGTRLLEMPKNGSLPRECDTTTCFRKCCPPGYTRDQNRCVRFNVTFDPYIASDNHPEGMNLSDLPKDKYYLVIGTACSGQWFRIDWEEEPETYPELNDNGTLTISQIMKDNTEVNTYGLHEYCAEYKEDETTIAYICLDTTHQAAVFTWLYTFGLLISVLGLLLTLTVYVAVDSLRDLHGKALVGHVGTLAIAYILLVAVQSSKDGDKSSFAPITCRGFAFAINFFLLSSFFWLHVMCIDALWGVMHATGCSPFPYPRAKKWKWLSHKKFWAAETEDSDATAEVVRREREKNLERLVFVLYCIYVSFLSLLPVFLALIQDLRPTIPKTYLDYNMKLRDCRFDEEKSSLKYYFSTVGVIEFINIIIFIVIMVKAFSIPWNTTGLQRVPKQKARMCFLLLLLMSSNWITDVISWAIGGTGWVVLHAFNIFEGLITFCIFVLEDRVKDCIKRKWPQLKLIKRTLRCCRDKPKDNIENPDEIIIMIPGVQVAPSQHQ